MSGPTVRSVYTSDDGTDYCVRLPQWERDIDNTAHTIAQTVTACTVEPELPKGFRRRKRYYRITATGREGSITVLDPLSTVNSVAANTAALIPLFNSAVVANNATLQGRTGEREKAL